jgi:hypothetical protein
VLSVVALFATANTVLLLLVAGTRMLYGMAHSGALPAILACVHPATRTPDIATFVQGFASLALLPFGGIVIRGGIAVTMLGVPIDLATPRARAEGGVTDESEARTGDREWLASGEPEPGPVDACLLIGSRFAGRERLILVRLVEPMHRALALVCALIVGGCTSVATPTPPPSASPAAATATIASSSTPTPATATPAPPSVTLVSTPTVPSPTASAAPQIGQRTTLSGCVAAGGLPDHGCTPGAIFASATTAQICTPG